jgi:hypothetical protein
MGHRHVNNKIRYIDVLNVLNVFNCGPLCVCSTVVIV